MTDPRKFDPTFDGAPVFGEQPAFKMVNLQLGTTAELDTFLGLPTGTNRYPADAGGQVFGVQGQFVGNTVSSVQQQVQTLLNFAGISATFLRPTGFAWPGIARQEFNCRFTSNDFSAPGGIQRIGVNQWGLNFNLVMRKVSNNP